MTIRTVKLGGTDWSDGEVLDAADLNGTIESFTAIKKDVSTVDATVYNGDPLTHSWTFTPGTACMLLGVVVEGQALTSEGGTLVLRIATDSSNGKTLAQNIVSLDSIAPGVGYAAYSIKMMAFGGAAATESGAPGLLLKESGTFSLTLMSTGNQNTTIKDTQFTIYWLDVSNMITTTSSGKIA